MKKLYIDFDGVIWDSIPYVYNYLKEMDILLYEKAMNKSEDEQDKALIRKIYSEMDWHKLIKKTKPIIGSIEALNTLYAQDIYEMHILTHCNSNAEIDAKTSVINKLIPGLDLIGVNKAILKNVAVDATDAFLIDDYTKNLIEWEKAGGLAIKFSAIEEISCQFHVIDTLHDLTKTIAQIENELIESETKEDSVCPLVVDFTE